MTTPPGSPPLPFDRPLFIGGFMASGKSTVGPLTARLLGVPFLDTDRLIEERARKSVGEIFAQEGEGVFRRQEAAVVREILPLRSVVVALGGGALEDPGLRDEIAEKGILVTLAVSAETARRRGASGPDRPLLRGDIAALLASRAPGYAAGRFSLDTEHTSPEATAKELVTRLFGDPPPPLPPRGPIPLPPFPGGGPEVFIGPGILREVPALVPGGDRARIVGDEITAPLFAPLLASAEGAYLLPRGEGAKTLTQVQALYDHFARSSVARATPVAALAGGTVGACAGFAAATWMRGVPLIQCPTTLLAMVDSAIGGKTGVNLPQGKNLVGAFHHPIAVVADVKCLQTLPAEEFRQGLAEAVKYALGEDQTLLGELEDLRPLILARDPAALTRLVERCARLKLAVVAEDGDETRGIRDRLNLGHTVGHALEAASGFRWKHGDAVAAGLAVALTLGERVGSCSSPFVVRGRELLGALGLPRRPDLPWGELLPFLGIDKKFRCGQCRFVLPVEGARCEVRPLSLGELEEAYEETMRL